MMDLRVRRIGAASGGADLDQVDLNSAGQGLGVPAVLRTAVTELVDQGDLEAPRVP
jgi:hypothetical protein